ncbi:GntR family transcriptional regulator/MocR family aminotransferase [Kribbella steppae]|uniref:GntR family transcriptional regulator/MocR family aminotransferase n=1 Tax=Kribbella steppae TaxID=2512223 RepID=A0A4R2HY52_9ACTN|nr:PLP-dependent aminotransferase family protein [Kribbella steppae]TCO35598.1 GntR family transcriptional regulator/MocR family aminotransferase [Kribbella steppae]
MDLHLHLGEEGGLAEQIYAQLHERISTDALPAGTVLPSSRELAARLSVSRATVVAAYERLAAHGLIRSRAGIGTVVTGQRIPAPAAPAASPLRPRAIWSAEHLAVPDLTAPATEFDFTVGVPARTRFPFARWRALLNDQLRTRTDVNYADPAGSARLRDALARHLVVSRGVRIASEQLVITTGAQQAFDIAARVLLEPGDTVAVEDPGYLPAYRGFLAHGARVVGVPVDSEGLVADRIPAGTRMVYVTPSHQFPLGMPMSESRRTALLAWAARNDAAIVEDDYDSEFRFTGRPLTPLQATDTEGRVLYVGSFSKTLLPALRVGFLGVPATLGEAARRAKFVADYGTGGHLQAALAAFIEDGDLARHIRRMRRSYERRHHLLIGTLREHFAGVLEPIESSGGTHMAALLTPGQPPDTILAARALAEGVNLGTISRWGIEGPGPSGFVFGYGAISTDQIPDGLATLRRVI